MGLLPNPLAAIQNLAETLSPIHLITVEFVDGFISRYCTKPLGAPYQGNAYQPIVKNSNLESIQRQTASGISAIPSVEIVFHDPGKAVFSLQQVRGFAGAKLTIVRVATDFRGGFTTDADPTFEGICEAATASQEATKVRANSQNVFVRQMLPNFPGASRCPKLNPTTDAQRAVAATNPLFRRCGETRPISVALPCSYTKETCTQPLAFAGFTYEFPATSTGSEYVSGKRVVLENQQLQLRDKFIPIVGGLVEVSGVLVSAVYREPNSTRFLVAICMDRPQEIIAVYVNDIALQMARGLDYEPYLVNDPLLSYEVSANGERLGRVQTDSPINGQGDPHGSMCVLWIRVHRRIHDSPDEPKVTAVVRGPKIRVWSNPLDQPDFQYTANPVWHLLNIRSHLGVEGSGDDVSSLVRSATYYDQMVSRVGPNGVQSTTPNLNIAYALTTRTAAGEVNDAFRSVMDAVVTPATGNGIRVLPRSTLAFMQPAVIQESEDQVARASFLPNGTAQNGYVAAHFRTTNCELLDVKHPPIVTTMVQSLMEDPPISRPNSLTTRVTEAINLHGRGSTESFQTIVPASWDAARRVNNRRLARALRGNPRNDFGTSDILIVSASGLKFRHLREGSIVAVTLDAYVNQLFMVSSKSESSDSKTATLELAFHRDEWYRLDYRQENDPISRDRRRNPTERLPFPLQANITRPPAASSHVDSTFGLSLGSEPNADGSVSVFAIVRGSFAATRYNDLQPPTLGLQGLAEQNAAGTFQGNSEYFVTVDCSQNVSGAPETWAASTVSAVCQVRIVPNISGYQLRIPISQWDERTTHWRAYVGANSYDQRFSLSGTGKPSEIVLQMDPDKSFGPPDPELSHLRFRTRKVYNAGVWGGKVTGIAGNSITFQDAVWAASQYNLYRLDGIGKGTPGNELSSAAGLVIQSHTVNSLTVSRPPATFGIQVGDVCVIRMKPTTGEDSDGLWFDDPGWINQYAATIEDDFFRDKNLLVQHAVSGNWYEYPIKKSVGAKFWINGSLLVPIDPASDRLLIVEPGWTDAGRSEELESGSHSTLRSWRVPVTNYDKAVVLVGVFTVDGGGFESVPSLSPIRLTWVEGVPGSVGGGGGGLTYS